MINKVCVLDLDLDLEVITSRLSSNWTRHRLYVELYCQYSCGKLFSVLLIKTLIFLCIFLCFSKILLCFWLCYWSILGLQSPWKHCLFYCCCCNFKQLNSKRCGIITCQLPPVLFIVVFIKVKKCCLLFDDINVWFWILWDITFTIWSHPEETITCALLDIF